MPYWRSPWVVVRARFGVSRNAASSRSSVASEAAPHRGTVSRHRGGSAYRVPVNWARGAAWPRRAGPITGPDAGMGRVLPVSALERRARLGRWMRAKKERPRRSGCGERCRRRGGDSHYSGITAPSSNVLAMADQRRPRRPGQTGQAVRRYERSAPGELVHLDIKKLRRSPGAAGEPTTGKAPGSAAPAAVATPACTSPSTITPGPPCVEVHDDETATRARTGCR